MQIELSKEEVEIINNWYIAFSHQPSFGKEDRELGTKLRETYNKKQDDELDCTSLQYD